MKNIRTIFYRRFLLSFFLMTLFLLVTGNPILVNETPLFPELPLGNLITWLGMISFCLVGISFIPSSSKYRYPQYVAFLLAILWLPVSALLTGNLRNEFTPNTLLNFEQWAILSSISVVLSFSTIVIYYLTTWFFSKKGN